MLENQNSILFFPMSPASILDIWLPLAGCQSPCEFGIGPVRSDLQFFQVCHVKFMVWCDFDLNSLVLNEVCFESRDNRNSKGSSKNAGLHDLKMEIYCSYQLFGSEITAFLRKLKLITHLEYTCNLGHHLMEIPVAPFRLPRTKPAYMTKWNRPCISHSFLNPSPVLHLRKFPFGYEHYCCEVEEFIIMSDCRQTIGALSVVFHKKVTFQLLKNPAKSLAENRGSVLRKL